MAGLRDYCCSNKLLDSGVSDETFLSEEAEEGKTN